MFVFVTIDDLLTPEGMTSLAAFLAALSTFIAVLRNSSTLSTIHDTSQEASRIAADASTHNSSALSRLEVKVDGLVAAQGLAGAPTAPPAPVAHPDRVASDAPA